MTYRRLLWVGCLSVALLGGGSPRSVARAQAPPQIDDSMRIDDSIGLSSVSAAAFGGAYRNPGWISISTDIRNDGDSDLDIELVATVSGSTADYRSAVEVPRGSHKRVPLMIRADYTSHNAVVALRVEGDEVVKSQVALEPLDQQLVIGAVPPETADAFRLGQSAGVRTFPETSDRLPHHAEGYAGLDLLLVGDIDLAALETEQILAIHEWVALGGTIVVLGGPGLGRTLSGLPEELRPAEAGSIVEMDGAALQQLAPDRTLPDEVVRGSELRPLPGAQVMLGDDEIPLAVGREVGAGSIRVIAIDPSIPPLDSWAGSDALLEMLIPDGSGGVWDDPPIATQTLAAALGNFREAALPPFGSVSALIILYILAVGPLNYIVLRRRDRLDLAWLTIPALTVVAVAGTYTTGRAVRGGRILLRQASIVRVVPEAGFARVHTVVGVFSPGGRSYDLEMEGLARGIQGEGSTLRTYQGEGSGIKGLRVDQWSMRTVAVDSIVPWPKAESIESQLGGRPSVRVNAARRRATPARVVQVTNPLGIKLEHAFSISYHDPDTGEPMIRDEKGRMGERDTINVTLSPTFSDPALQDDLTYFGGEKRVIGVWPRHRFYGADPSSDGILRDGLMAALGLGDTYYSPPPPPRSYPQPGPGTSSVPSGRARFLGQRHVRLPLVAGYTDTSPIKVELTPGEDDADAMSLVYTEIPLSLQSGAEQEGRPANNGEADQLSAIPRLIPDRIASGSNGGRR